MWVRMHLDVGWYDDADATFDLAVCARLGVRGIGRPFAGGGTACDDAGCAVMFVRIAEGSVATTSTTRSNGLAGTSADDRSALRARLAQVWENGNVYQADPTAGVTTDDLALEGAVSDAKDRR